MSGGWQGAGRQAAVLLAQAARRASQYASSTSTPSFEPSFGCTALQHAALQQRCGTPGASPSGGVTGGCGSSWLSQRCISGSATPAAETQRQELDEPQEQLREVGPRLSGALAADTPPQADSARHTLLSALQQFQDQSHRSRRGRFRTRQEDEMHYSIAPISGQQHSSEQERAEYFRQWGRQLEKETTVLREAVREYEEAAESAKSRSDAAAMGPTQEVLRKWFPTVTARIQREQNEIMQGVRRRDVSVYGPYFCLLEPKYMTVIALNNTLNMVLYRARGDHEEFGRVGITMLTSALGRAVQQQVHLEQLKKKIRQDNQRRRDLQRAWQEGQAAKQALAEKGVAEFSPFDANSWRSRFEELGETLPADSKDWFRDDSEYALRSKQTRKRWVKAAPSKTKGEAARQLKKHARIALGDDAVWSPEVLLKIGSKLLELLIDSAEWTLPDGRTVPAFSQSVVFERKRGVKFHRMGYLTAHPAVLRAIERNEEIAKTAFPKFKPMLVPPAPWRSADTGAHLTVRSFVMRTREQQANRQLLQKADRAMAQGKPGASQVYNALNVLGSLGWAINQPVLDAALAAWQAGGDVAGLPARNLPPPPDEPRPPRSFRTVSTPNQLLAYFAAPAPVEARGIRWEYLRAKKLRDEQFSLKCDLEYKLQVAREFRDEPAFYFPHSLDFRGRAYPMHPHLNHLGSDICRGLLHFAQAQPLGHDGLYWLNVSVANLYGGGADKLPMDERAAFGEAHLPQILQTADAPLAPESMWWREADEPWQLLAVCLDIAGAVRSGNPVAYESRLPVHQDGSCNGLQHYAALGRDAWGGFAVNLTPTDRPQDVYTEIANVVRQKVAEDTANGHKWAPRVYDFIDRKLVKQTVMTSVYGVTFVGARQQISNRLKEKGWTDDTEIFRTASYTAKVTLDSLLHMFTSAKDIMGWLAECASVIAAEDKPVQWTTPLGLPVIQPYRNMRKQAVHTVLQTMVLERHTDALPVMKARQRSAFPPNYIHSIDSSHMMLTALACAGEGLAFAGVHDSFWTHAGSVPRMNQLLREQFVALHSQPLLEQLLASFQEQHPGAEFPALPPRGELDLNSVKDSTYFFS